MISGTPFFFTTQEKVENIPCSSDFSSNSSSNSPIEEIYGDKNINLIHLYNLQNKFTINNINYEQNLTKEYKRKRSNKSKFSSEEDKKLLDIVAKYGENNWKKIAEQMEGRSTRQCRDRYRHYLSPKINQNNWTEEEDTVLVKKVEEIGFRWKLLEKFFNDRNEIQIRNRYYQITHNIIKNNDNNEHTQSDYQDQSENYIFNNDITFNNEQNYFNSSDYGDDSDVDQDYFYMSEI